MPNWCNNILTISEPSAELVDYLKAEGFSFDKIKPMPPELKQTEDWDGRAWAVGNWGTKWDLDENPLLFDSIQEKQISFCFETAWSPPMGAIEALSEKFPDDHFLLQYLEMGMGFFGEASFQDGYAIEDSVDENQESMMKFAKEVFGYEFDDEE
jgi:hypothetical protein